MLDPPRFGAGATYGERLGDAGFWLPYASVALSRSGLPTEAMTSGFVGTYPTLLGDGVVVKLFGHFGDWRASFDVELAANHAIAGHDEIAAPRVLAHGRLFPALADDWPFLVMQRLRGRAWRDADLSPTTRRQIAGLLGDQLRSVHAVPPPELERAHPNWLTEHGRDLVERHRRWGSLPARLVDELETFVADYAPTRTCLVHGDVTEDHIFVDDDGEYAGLIDWGDAMITDPLYELGALHLGAFGADRDLLRAFLDGYSWPDDARFSRRALQVALMHQFDLFTGVRKIAADAASLAELAGALWEP